jgi:isoleucyl-tRNA synthetase
MFPKADEPGLKGGVETSEWKQLFSVRRFVLFALEKKRKDGVIGKALEAKVLIDAEPLTQALLDRYSASLEEIFNVSQVEVRMVSSDALNDWALSCENQIRPEADTNTSLTPSPEGDGYDLFRAEVVRAEGSKCNRCLRYYRDDDLKLHVRQFGPWENVCGRCADALTQMGFKEDGR